jgi:hypothetical protein
MMKDKTRHAPKGLKVTNPARNLADLALALFGPEHGIELELPPGRTTREPPRFDGPDFDPVDDSVAE